MSDRIVIALDVSSGGEALRLVDTLTGAAGMFKIGSQLFVAEGPAIVREIVARGCRVFLDLKFHDIPNTVTKAAVEAARLGVSMMTIHASGGRAMMSSVAAGLREGFGEDRPIVVAVTALTSLSDAALRECGVSRSMDEQVRELALLARDSGIDGVVCSPKEIAMIRGAAGPGFKIVTPGIRMCGQPLHDQERAATPREAVARGADYLVVGRAVTDDADPRAALERLIQSL
ncbi:MAG TPA: orotidine-5'-phosphate decarboxylase [Terriglobia bacterium]|nr:orotidine-5'-phosphate decarboxylase [Terriglobia bacterium]